MPSLPSSDCKYSAIVFFRNRIAVVKKTKHEGLAVLHKRRTFPVTRIPGLFKQLGRKFHVVGEGLEVYVAIRNRACVKRIGRRLEAMKDALRDHRLIDCVLNGRANFELLQMFIIRVEHDMTRGGRRRNGYSEFLAGSILIERIRIDHVFAPDEIDFALLECKDSRLIVPESP